MLGDFNNNQQLVNTNNLINSNQMINNTQTQINTYTNSEENFVNKSSSD